MMSVKAATRSPFRNPVTPAPTSSTTPAASEPWTLAASNRNGYFQSLGFDAATSTASPTRQRVLRPACPCEVERGGGARRSDRGLLTPDQELARPGLGDGTVDELALGFADEDCLHCGCSGCEVWLCEWPYECRKGRPVLAR